LRESIAFLRGVGNPRLGPHFVPAIVLLATFTIPLFLADLALEGRCEEYLFQRIPAFPRVAVAAGLALIVALFSANTGGAFVYFQF
jgi:hypothetical protein